MRLLNGGSAVAALTAILSCSDSSTTAPAALQSRRDPALDGIRVVVMQHPYSMKNPGSQASLTVQSAVPSLPAASRDVVAAAAPEAPSTYTVSVVPFEPEAAPENFLLDCDDCVAYDVPIGFEFAFFGNTYSKLHVASNGLIGFDPSLQDGCCSGWGIPSDDIYNNIIALAWTDLNASAPGSDIRYQTRGEAPNRRFIVQWNSVPEYYMGPGRLSGQIVLSEGSNDITLYTSVMDVANEWHMVTQGIENANGSEAEFLPGRVQNHFKLLNDGVRFSIRPLTKPPVLEPVENLSFNTDPGVCEAKVSVLAPGVVGNPPGTTVSGERNDKLALDAGYPKGVTTITWMATDAAGLTEVESQTITVADHEAPHITPPADIVAPNDPGLATAYVNVGSAHVEDNCPNYTLGEAPNGVYPVGVTEVVWNAVDESGNPGTAKQLVTVKDVEAPTISVSSDITVNATSPAGALVSFINFGHDNVGVTSFACDHISGNLFPIGTTSVACSALDAAGNSSAPASFVVKVLGAPDQIVNLIEFIRGLPIPEPHRTELVNALQSALSDPRSTRVACPYLTAFMSSVRAKTPSVFSAAKSAQILSDAARIGAVIGCSGF